MFNDAPKSLETARDQVQSLLQLAELASKKTPIDSTAESTSTPHNLTTNLEITQSLSWQESAWRRCTKQAKLLEEILGPLLCETADSRIQRVWKRVSSVKKEKAIQQVVDEIEKQKSILNLWYAQECFGNVDALKKVAEEDVAQLICLVRNRSDLRCFCYCCCCCLLTFEATRGESTYVRIHQILKLPSSGCKEF